MASNSLSSVAAIIVVGLLILGTVYYTSAQISSQVSSLSSQNGGLMTENFALQSEIVSLQVNLQSVSSLAQENVNLAARTPTTATEMLTNTYVETETTTSISTLSLTSTSTVYPIPDNVTVYVAPSGEFTDYEIAAGSVSLTGSLNHAQAFLVTPVFQGESISVTITLSCPGSTGPSASADLYVNGGLVSYAAVACGGQVTGQISYVL